MLPEINGGFETASGGTSISSPPVNQWMTHYLTNTHSAPPTSQDVGGRDTEGNSGLFPVNPLNPRQSPAVAWWARPAPCAPSPHRRGAPGRLGVCHTRCSGWGDGQVEGILPIDTLLSYTGGSGNIATTHFTRCSPGGIVETAVSHEEGPWQRQGQPTGWSPPGLRLLTYIMGWRPPWACCCRATHRSLARSRKVPQGCWARGLWGADWPPLQGGVLAIQEPQQGSPRQGGVRPPGDLSGQGCWAEKGL